MHPPIPVGLATKFGVLFAVLAALPPFIEEIVALVENTALHWTQANKLALISAAVITAITIAGRMAQAWAAIKKGP